MSRRSYASRIKASSIFKRRSVDWDKDMHNTCKEWLSVYMTRPNFLGNIFPCSCAIMYLLSNSSTRENNSAARIDLQTRLDFEDVKCTTLTFPFWKFRNMTKIPSWDYLSLLTPKAESIQTTTSTVSAGM